MIEGGSFKESYAVLLKIHCCRSCVTSNTVCCWTLRMAHHSLFCRTGVGQHDGLEAAGGGTPGTCTGGATIPPSSPAREGEEGTSHHPITGWYRQKTFIQNPRGQRWAVDKIREKTCLIASYLECFCKTGFRRKLIHLWKCQVMFDGGVHRK